MGYQLIFCYLPAVLCVALGYSLTKDTTRYIATHVYDADGRYKNFFRTTTFGKQWSLKINTEKYGIDFITFFASDNYRPLQYSCAYSRALCDFTVTKGSHYPSTHHTRVVAYLKQPIHLSVPTMSGYLMICTGTVSMFWKRPLKNAGQDFSCVPALLSQSQGEVIEMPPLPDQAICPDLVSCINGKLIIPDKEASDISELDIHVMYMTEDNYRDMQSGRLTEVIVPLLEQVYILYLYGTVDRLEGQQCHFSSPIDDNIPAWINQQSLKQFRYAIKSNPGNSGVYSFTCSTTYRDVLDGNTSHILVTKKSLNITFISGPKIVLEGQKNYVKYFPPNVTTATILIYVYTTSPLVSFEVNRIDKKKSDVFFAPFVSNSPYDIIWKHSIRVPRLGYEENGVYEIEVLNEDGEKTTQRFTLLKAKVLSVIVSPVRLHVEEGSLVQLECAAIGNLIENIEWARDIEEIAENENFFVTDLKYSLEESAGLRLTIQKTKLENSGIYECTVSNKYQKVTEAVELLVWPIGGPYLSPNSAKSSSSLTPLPSGPTVLDISEKELEREYMFYRRAFPKNRPRKGQQMTGEILGAVISAIVFVGVIILVILLLYFYRHKIMNRWRGRVSKIDEEGFESDSEDLESDSEGVVSLKGTHDRKVAGRQKREKRK